MFHAATPTSVAAFLLICVGVLTAFLCGIWTSARRDGADPVRRTARAAFAAAAWLALLLLAVASGWVARGPRHVMVLASGIIAVSLAIGLSRVGRWLSGCPMAWLVGFQAFRLPLELVLHAWAGQGVIPETMTWTGANWDIVSGVTALVLAPMARRSTRAAWVANVVGFVLLANVLRVAVMSSPLPFAWPVVPRLELILHVPYALIVPVCVGGALLGHLALTRALLRSRSAQHR